MIRYAAKPKPEKLSTRPNPKVFLKPYPKILL